MLCKVLRECMILGQHYGAGEAVDLRDDVAQKMAGRGFVAVEGAEPEPAVEPEPEPKPAPKKKAVKKAAK